MPSLRREIEPERPRYWMRMASTVSGAVAARISASAVVASCWSWRSIRRRRRSGGEGGGKRTE